MARTRTTTLRLWRALMPALCLLMVGPVAAHDFGDESRSESPPPPPPVPALPCGQCPCPAPPAEGATDGDASPQETENNDGTANPEAAQGICSDPVDAFTGRFTTTHVDLVVNGVYPIRFVRRYDSQSEYDSPLGYGWTHGFDLRLFEYPDGTFVVRSRNGLRIHYDSNHDHSNPRRGRAPELTESGGTYTLRYPSGEKHFFDAEGRLTAQEDAQGNRLEMEYDPLGGSAMKKPLSGISAYAVDPNTPMTIAEVYQLRRVNEVTRDGQATERWLGLDYHATTGRLTRVYSHDGREVLYHTTSASEPADRGNLARVEGLEGIEINYVYEDPNDIHNLTQFDRGPGTTPTTNVYDPQDRVDAQYTGTDQSDRWWDFQYDTPAEGSTTIARHIVRLDATTDTATTVYSFDGAGQLTKKVDALGNVLTYTREANRHYLTEVKAERNDPGGLVLEKTVDLTYYPEIDPGTMQPHPMAGNLATRVVDIGGSDLTETWTWEHDWVRSYERVWAAEPTHIFRTEYVFEQNGTPEGPGYDSALPPTNIHEIKRQTSPGFFETTTLTHATSNGRLATVTPPEADPGNPDGLKIVRSYFPTTDPAGQAGLLEQVSLELTVGADPHLERSFTYDAKSHLASVSDAITTPGPNTTTFQFDDLGRLTQLTNANNESTLLTYTGPNEGLSDPATWPAGRLLGGVEIGQTGSERQIRQLRYDARGRLVDVYRQNDADELVRFVSYAYDSDANRAKVTDGESRETTFGYDRLKRLVAVTDASTNLTQFAYDATGNRTQLTDALTRVTKFGYDPLNRLTQVTQDEGGLGLVTQFTYDAAGNVTEVLDPEQTAAPSAGTTYAYDALSRLTSVTHPLSQSVTYCYDGRGRLDRVINARGQGLDYRYFAWGGLEAVDHGSVADCVGTPGTATRTVSYAYDNNGNLLTTTDDQIPASPLYTFTYDPLNRVDTVTAHYIPNAPVLDSDYDRFGNRSGLDLTQGTETLSHAWLYDDLDRLDQVSFPGRPQSPSIGYFQNDDLQTWPHGNGLVSSYAYDPAGPVDSITVAGGSELHKLSYGFDHLLNVATIAEAIDGMAVGDHGYLYDTVSRLTDATHAAPLVPSGDEDFTYDGSGNRDDPNAPGSFMYDDNHRITASPGRGYVPDADGNLTEINNGATPTPTVLSTLAWDATNRLQTYTNAVTGQTATYRYDPFGRRVSKTVDGTLTYYLWDGDRLLAEYDDAGARTVRYAYAGGFAPVEVMYGPGGECSDGVDNDGDTLTDFSGGDPDCADAGDSSEGTELDVHTDHLDTPRMLTDNSGAAVWRAAYEAYGKAHFGAGNTLAEPFNIRFPGQYFDEETGLHSNRFRYYSPELGRYVSAEPIGQFGLTAIYGVSLPERAFAPGGPQRGPVVGFTGANLYGYALNDPVNLMDPNGQFAQVAGGFFGGAAAGGIVGGIVGGVRAAGQGGDTGDIIAGAATGAAIGAAVGGVTGAAASVGVFTPLQVSAQQAAGATGLDLFISGAQFGFAGARLPGILGAFASTLFGNPGDANGAEGGVCPVDTGPPGGDELAGEFTGGLGALNRR